MSLKISCITHFKQKTVLKMMIVRKIVFQEHILLLPRKNMRANYAAIPHRDLRIKQFHHNVYS